MSKLSDEVIAQLRTRLGWWLVRVGFRLIGAGRGVGLCAGCGPRDAAGGLDEDGACATCGADAYHTWHLEGQR